MIKTNNLTVVDTRFSLNPKETGKRDFDGRIPDKSPPQCKARVDAMTANVRKLSLKAAKELVADPSTPADLIEEIASFAGYNVRVGLIKDPDTPIGFLSDVLAGVDGGLKDLVTERPDAEHFLTQLCRDPNSRVRRGIAIAETIPESVMERLSRDSSEEVCLALAENNDVSLSEVVVLQLAQHPSSEVRMALVNGYGSREFGHAALLILAEDKDEDVRSTLAASVYVTPEVLEKLATDPSESVREAVAENEFTPAHVIASLSGEIASLDRKRQEKDKQRKAYLSLQDEVLAYETVFDSGRREMMITITVPGPDKAWNFISGETYPPLKDKGIGADKVAESDMELLDTIRSYVANGNFILDVEDPEEVKDDWEYPYVSLSSDLIGKWKLDEDGRVLRVTWQVPDWVADNPGWYPDELQQCYKDWFMNQDFD